MGSSSYSSSYLLLLHLPWPLPCWTDPVNSLPKERRQYRKKELSLFPCDTVITTSILLFLSHYSLLCLALLFPLQAPCLQTDCRNKSGAGSNNDTSSVSCFNTFWRNQPNNTNDWAFQLRIDETLVPEGRLENCFWESLRALPSDCSLFISSQDPVIQKLFFLYRRDVKKRKKTSVPFWEFRNDTSRILTNFSLLLASIALKSWRAINKLRPLVNTTYCRRRLQTQAFSSIYNWKHWRDWRMDGGWMDEWMEEKMDRQIINEWMDKNRRMMDVWKNRSRELNTEYNTWFVDATCSFFSYSLLDKILQGESCSQK